MTIGGGLGGEIGFDAGRNVSVADVNVSTVAGSQEAVSILDGALKAVDSQRASLECIQNRFAHSISTLNNVNENVNASRSRIRDTDYARESTAMTKAQILQQASTSVLAQPKQSPSAALSLLG